MLSSKRLRKVWPKVSHTSGALPGAELVSDQTSGDFRRVAIRLPSDRRSLHDNYERADHILRALHITDSEMVGRVAPVANTDINPHAGEIVTVLVVAPYRPWWQRVIHALRPPKLAILT